MLDYLVSTRRISEPTLKQFQVGFFPGRVHHEFANRIITPFHNTYGVPIALTSRGWHNKKNFFHESFDKSIYLYGLYFAKKHIIKYNRVVIVEGEFDVMNMHSGGIPYTVGLCGSALSIKQIALLTRYCSNIYIIYDADDKADTSYNRIVQINNQYELWRHGVSLYRTTLPNGYDPDDYLLNFGRKNLLGILRDSRKV